MVWRRLLRHVKTLGNMTWPPRSQGAWVCQDRMVIKQIPLLPAVHCICAVRQTCKLLHCCKRPSCICLCIQLSSYTFLFQLLVRRGNEGKPTSSQKLQKI